MVLCTPLDFHRKYWPGKDFSSSWILVGFKCVFRITGIPGSYFKNTVLCEATPGSRTDAAECSIPHHGLYKL